MNNIKCATNKALLRDSKDSKCVMLVLTLCKIRYVKRAIAPGNTPRVIQTLNSAIKQCNKLM